MHAGKPTRRAHLDFETRSAIDLKHAGVHRYAESVTTQPWCMSWWFDDEKRMRHWAPLGLDPQELLDHIAAGGMVVIHNGPFDRTIWNKVVRRWWCPHWPELPIEQVDCTVSRCAALGIPQALDIVTEVLNTRANKDREGKKLMLKMAKPRTRERCHYCAGNGCVACLETGELYTWWDAPELRARLQLYCDDDVVTETEVDTRVPALTAYERAVWELDQRINERGFALDVVMIQKFMDLVEHARDKLDWKMSELTRGYVKKCSQVKKLVEWINARGIRCRSIAKGEQEELILAAREEAHWQPGELPPLIEQAIVLRQIASKSSTAKLKAMLACVCADGRARGQIQYHGAFNGRFAGRLIQVHNLYRVDPERDGDAIKLTIELVKIARSIADAYLAVDMMVGAPMVATAKCMRSMIVAAPGMKLYGADLSNIEGRINAFLANEEWKLRAFAAYDAGLGPDLYKLAYSRSFGIEVDAVDKSQRQIGKVQELALGFGGALGAFLNMAANYLIKIPRIAEVVKATVGENLWLSTAAEYSRATRRYDLNRDQWTALTIVVRGWREANAAIAAGWKELEHAAIEAVANPGLVTYAYDARVRYSVQRGILWCSLPSNRIIAYMAPRVLAVTTRIYRDNNSAELFEMDKAGLPWMDRFNIDIFAPLEPQFDVLEQFGYVTQVEERVKRRVDYEGYEGETKHWTTQSLYGGMQCAHVVSGTARDTLVDRMFAVERAGYPIVLHVHDEVLCEKLDGTGSAEVLEKIIGTNPPFLPGMPMAASAWEGYRYEK